MDDSALRPHAEPLSPAAAVRMEAAGRKGGHELYSVTAEPAGCIRRDSGQVGATFYRHTAGGRHRLVVVLPIWGASTYPQRRVVQRLLRRGAESTHVLEIHGERTVLDWDALEAAPDEERFLEQLAGAASCLADAVTDARRLVSWAAVLEGVDPQRVGIVGFSIGAAAASLAMGPGLGFRYTTRRIVDFLDRRLKRS